MSELRRFSESDLSELRDMAVRRVEIGRRDRRPLPCPAGRAGAEKVAAWAEGWRGEWAVADALGLPRPRSVGWPDPGWDLVAPSGHLVQVRYRSRPDGWLLHTVGKPLPADVLVLVVSTGNPREVRIAGAVRASRFLAEARRGDFGFGRSLWMPQDELDRWDDWRPMLAAAA